MARGTCGDPGQRIGGIHTIYRRIPIETWPKPTVRRWLCVNVPPNGNQCQYLWKIFSPRCHSSVTILTFRANSMSFLLNADTWVKCNIAGIIYRFTVPRNFSKLISNMPYLLTHFDFISSL